LKGWDEEDQGGKGDSNKFLERGCAGPARGGRGFNTKDEGFQKRKESESGSTAFPQSERERRQRDD